MKFLLIVAIFCCGFLSNSYAGFTFPNSDNPVISANDYWIETTICTVVIKVPIEVNKPLQINTPIDQLTSMSAVCTSNINGQNIIKGGVRSLIGLGYRITSLSHEVTTLPSVLQDSKIELLITALFSLEKPNVVHPSSKTR